MCSWSPVKSGAPAVASASGATVMISSADLQGQKIVPASQSQLIYGTVPCWSAAIGMGFMHETAGAFTWAGGALVLAASLWGSQSSK